MANVKVRRGSEGPAHDPYSYTEVTFYFTNKRRKPVTYHGGLGAWVRHGKRRYEGYHGHKDPALIFKRLTGLSVVQAERIPDIIFGRYLRKLSPQQRHNVMMCIEADRDMLANCR